MLLDFHDLRFLHPFPSQIALLLRLASEDSGTRGQETTHQADGEELFRGIELFCR